MMDQMKGKTIQNPNSIEMKQESPSHLQESPPLTRKSKAGQPNSSLPTDSSKTQKRMRNLPVISLLKLIGEKKLSVGDKVFYKRQKGKVVLKEGIVRLQGIECICCRKIYSLSKLEEHAGKSTHRASQHIYLESGESLANCHSELYQDGGNQMKSGSEDHLPIQQAGSAHSRGCSSEETESDSASSSCNLDLTLGNTVCYICLQNDNGLLACGGECMSGFHISCIGLEAFPENI